MLPAGLWYVRETEKGIMGVLHEKYRFYLMVHRHKLIRKWNYDLALLKIL